MSLWSRKYFRYYSQLDWECGTSSCLWTFPISYASGCSFFYIRIQWSVIIDLCLIYMWLDSYLWQFNLFRAFDSLSASQLYHADKPFWGQMFFCLVSIVHVPAPVGLLTFWHSSYRKRAFIYGHHVQCSVLKK